MRGYAKYVAVEIETARNPGYPAAIALSKKTDLVAGLGFGLRANLLWFFREQPKVLHFDEGVFIFMLSTGLIFDALEPILWIFAASQLFLGFYRTIQRGVRIHENRQIPIRK